MTDSTLPAPALLDWVRKELRTPVSVTAHPSPTREDSRVWALRRPDGVRFCLKVSSRPLSYERETFALRHAVPALGSGHAPQLRASSAEHLALLLTAVPGRPLGRLKLTPAEEVRAHWQGGALLARLHAAGDLSGPRRAEAARSLRAAADEAEEYLQQAAGRLTPAERRLVRELTERLRCLPPLPLAFVHGAARPRNLLWSPASAQACWIGFERARFATVVHDFVPMSCGIWAERPELAAACFRGYGRELVPEEHYALRGLAALDAVRCLVRGPAHHDAATTARGRRTLDQLTAGAFGELHALARSR
ncbi:aminoglycoside phosphotransferase family protein [Streptomyces sp. RY43-2]|uniref:Aminoglycoside phosphotransferase family protein n=1 Tax=Streptomyces macrolidinus TaxID=2952607 RepID=A0ABT0ZIF6_9ACTN|nr:aminoglycoside phosphotransferase family protein [Streptomyces macrolidinus]MCN9243382.1 aminoglycoside phosphotransferase family protein [Streptomyces macrolidinus]